MFSAYFLYTWSHQIVMEIMAKLLPDNEADNITREAFYQCKPIYWDSM